ncbi:MAG: hypothetical protein HY593_00735 [Candidatus Omnitrophica bacterium]|nr:hypothetical protein [Candidatus Omnitrophota bacterium]
MNFIEFQRKYKNAPLIYSRDVVRESRNQKQAVRNQLRRWQARKLLLKLKKGVYVLRGETAPDLNWIANRLYEPSYVSLEYALSFYDLIPERVTDVLSVTTLKTKTFQNELGNFVYRHLKPETFRGFKKAGDPKLPFLIAEPEKALVDFIYFHLPMFGKDPAAVLKESYRLQNHEELDKGKLRRMGKLFGSLKLMRVLDDVCRMMEGES